MENSQKDFKEKELSQQAQTSEGVLTADEPLPSIESAAHSAADCPAERAKKRRGLIIYLGVMAAAILLLLLVSYLMQQRLQAQAEWEVSVAKQGFLQNIDALQMENEQLKASLQQQSGELQSVQARADALAQTNDTQKSHIEATEQLLTLSNLVDKRKLRDAEALAEKMVDEGAAERLSDEGKALFSALLKKIG